MGFSIKSMLPRSLLGRSLMILVVPVVVVQIVTAFVFFDRHWERVTQRLSEALAGEIALIAEQVELAETEGEREIFMAQSIRLLDVAVSYRAGAVLEQNNTILADAGWEKIVAGIFVPELERSLNRPFMLSLKFEEKWVFLDVQLADGVMKTSFPQRRLFSSSGYIYLLWVFGSALLLLLVAVAFMRNQVRPIRKLAAAAERFGRGQDVQFFRPQGAREVRQAGEAFISMHTRIRRQIEQRTLMLAGVSHDLRTPLTRLKLQLSMMEGQSDVADMLDDVRDMEAMITGYLTFARGDGDEAEENVDLIAFFDDIAVGYEGQALDLHIDAGVPLQLLIRPVAMERCFNNLISNAARYGDVVRLRVSIDQDKRLQCVVEDNGPGLAEDQYADVFKPFYRADEARSAAQGSVGLGLSIAMDIVHAHGGMIWLDRSVDLGGLAVHVCLPV